MNNQAMNLEDSRKQENYLKTWRWEISLGTDLGWADP